MTQRIVVLGGLGDAYLMAALFDGFRQHYNRDAILVIKGMYAHLFDLFGVPYEIDDETTFGSESRPNWQKTYDNALGNGRHFFAHPCMRRTQIKLDELPARERISQADMFRLILGLPLDSPLAQPKVPSLPVQLNSVMIVEATTWPNTQPSFYPKLIKALQDTGRYVWVNDKKLPLKDLLERASATEWVIGPQCGLMSIFVTGRWPCRKTLVTPDIDNGRGGDYWAKSTFPYAYVRQFAGLDFDVEEYKIEDDNHDTLIDAIINGVNARKLRPHIPNPVYSVDMALSPGDFLDRFAVLQVKRNRFSPDRKALIEREYQRHLEAASGLLKNAGAVRGFMDLVDAHDTAFMVLERAIPDALNGGMAVEDHTAVIKLNRDRVKLKQQIDAALAPGMSEQKSYYRD